MVREDIRKIRHGTFVRDNRHGVCPEERIPTGGTYSTTA